MTGPDLARELIRNAVLVLSRGAGREPVSRPVFRDRPDDGLTVLEPDPLAGIRAAADLQHAAARVARECARYAREDGSTWDEISGSLYSGRDDLTPGGKAAEAFYYLAADLGSGPSFAWTCPQCLKTVIDRGPDAGSPADAERGHAEGCGRLAETITAREAQWKDSGHEGH